MAMTFRAPWWGFFALGICAAHECKHDTGGSCRLFACDAARHAICTGGSCMCAPGMCANHAGNCHVDILHRTCSGYDFEMGNIHNEPSEPECTFRKQYGSNVDPDAFAHTAFETPKDGVRSVAFKFPDRPDGSKTHRKIGLTQDMSDDENMDHGCYVETRLDGRLISQGAVGFFTPTDIFNMSVDGVEDAAVSITKNGEFFGMIRLDFQRAMNIKMFLTEHEAQIDILEIQTIADCVWGVWSQWSGCSTTCGDGIASRSRSRDVEARMGGVECPGDSSDDRQCNLRPCPIDCEWNDWQEWSDCSVSCGEGIATRTRTKAVEEQFDGTCDGDATEDRQCVQPNCPIDCVWADWQEWSSCSVTCGPGTSTRTREVAVADQYGGAQCDGEASDEESCQVVECPVDCAWGEWSKWSVCSATCGGGAHSRSRDITQQDMYNGAPCEGPAAETYACGMFDCPVVDCVWSDWSSWTECTVSCGGGLYSKSRDIVSGAKFGGLRCEGASVVTASCSNDLCPQPECALSKWDEWSACTQSCGGGVSTRSRSVTSVPETAPTFCDDPTTRIRECNTAPCENYVPWVVTNMRQSDLEFRSDGGEASAITSSDSVVAITLQCPTDRVAFGLVADDEDPFATGGYMTVHNGVVRTSVDGVSEVCTSKDQLTVSIEGPDFVFLKNSDEFGRTNGGAVASLFAKILMREAGSVRVMQVLLSGGDKEPAIMTLAAEPLPASHLRSSEVAVETSVSGGSLPLLISFCTGAAFTTAVTFAILGRQGFRQRQLMEPMLQG